MGTHSYSGWQLAIGSYFIIAVFFFLCWVCARVLASTPAPNCQKRTTTKCKNGSHQNSVTCSSIMLLVFVCVAFVIACAYVDLILGFAIRYTYANKLLVDSVCGVPAHILALISFIVFLFALFWCVQIECYASYGKCIWRWQCCYDTGWLRYMKMKYFWIHRDIQKWDAMKFERTKPIAEITECRIYVEIMHRLAAIWLHCVWVGGAARRSQCVSTWETIATHIPIYLIYYSEKFEGESETNAKQEVLVCSLFNAHPSAWHYHNHQIIMCNLFCGNFAGKIRSNRCGEPKDIHKCATFVQCVFVPIIHWWTANISFWFTWKFGKLPYPE